MKIAIFNYSSSGLFHYAACLANTLAKNEDAEILFITSRFNNLDLINRAPNIRLVTQPVPNRLPGFFAWLVNPAQQQRLYREITRFNPDVIHLADSHAAYVPHAWWLKRYPIVFTQHDPLVHQGDVYPFTSRVIHRTEQWLADKIVVHGHYIKSILVGRGISARQISIIPHGDYSFYLKWRRPDVMKVPHAVLFFGRVVDYKGLDVLLRSIIQLQREHTPVHLIIAGAGDLQKYRPLLQKIRHKLINNNSIPDEQVIRYFQMSTMVALPYREASQSGIAAIAMPAGLPIVATRVGSLPEVLRDGVNSLLVEPGSVSAFAAAIKRLLESETLRQKLANGAKQTVQERLLWRHTAKQYYQQYQLLL
jgi:alpha-maltose-1-phosphate synthase